MPEQEQPADKSHKQGELPDDLLDSVAGGGKTGAQGGVPLKDERAEVEQQV